MDTYKAIKFLYPKAEIGKDYILRDYGDGVVHIENWKLPTPIPTLVELKAAEAQSEELARDIEAGNLLENRLIKTLLIVLESHFQLASGTLRNRMKAELKKGV